MRRRFLTAGLAASIALLAGIALGEGRAEAHGGGLNRCGCHHVRRTGECHCHQDRGCGCECEPDRCR
ncbi:MAG: hypothetical protein AB7S26_09760 [Sandaracinaceae bacterium]